MTFCLDTNAVIAVLNDGASPVSLELARKLNAQVVVGLPAIVLFELWFGVAKSVHRDLNTSRINAFLEGPLVQWPFDEDDAAEAGVIRAALERAGRLIGPYDILVAAQARRRGAVLVTDNTREFARVGGLKTENWLRR